MNPREVSPQPKDPQRRRSVPPDVPADGALLTAITLPCAPCAAPPRAGPSTKLGGSCLV